MWQISYGEVAYRNWEMLYLWTRGPQQDKVPCVYRLMQPIKGPGEGTSVYKLWMPAQGWPRRERRRLLNV